ncbi:hypothetical protein [Pantoea ananatis]|uniref:hypothetical protein n=1 Tax=Pantoea ananas TaxID=553 RepID=UPI00187C9EF0|nr:hypothetical protein [Pantoea ananatis]
MTEKLMKFTSLTRRELDKLTDHYSDMKETVGQLAERVTSAVYKETGAGRF